MRTPFAGLEQILKCVIENTGHANNPDISDEERYNNVMKVLFGTEGLSAGRTPKIPDEIFYIVGKRVNEGENPSKVINEIATEVVGTYYGKDEAISPNGITPYERCVDTMKTRFSRNENRFRDRTKIIQNLPKQGTKKPTQGNLDILEILNDVAARDAAVVTSCLKKAGWPI